MVPQYEIKLRGHVDDRRDGPFAGLAFAHRTDAQGAPVTILRGPVRDDAELHGLLARIRDLGIPLLEVKRAPGGGDKAHLPPETS